MKIKPEHIEVLRDRIDTFLSANPTVHGLYENGQFPRSEKVKDLQMRFCFDLLHFAGLTRFTCDEIYPYAHDSHLFTALKSVCPVVVRRY